MDWDTETEGCWDDLVLQPSGGAEENGGSGGAVVGGGGMSSGPGTDRLRANFMAGGCRNCFSSSGTPAVQHSQMEKKTSWDEIRIYRQCRVGVREADEQEKKKSFGANKSGEEMEAEKRKAEGNL